MSDKHLSSLFDAELSGLSAQVLAMGGLAESQLSQAVYALTHGSLETAEQVLAIERQVNAMEVRIDAELSDLIARRQPTARDLRLVIAVAKSIGNLERVGDEASRIARAVQRLHQGDAMRRLRVPLADAAFTAGLAIEQLRRALDAFARLDAAGALGVLRRDPAIDAEFDGLLRKLVTYMMEDPRTISAAVDLVFVAKAIERIGDHAKNLAEQVIYAVQGDDVRHVPLEALESAQAAAAPASA